MRRNSAVPAAINQEVSSMIVGLARTAFAAVVVLLVAVPVSHAATVSYDGNTVVFAAEAGETLDVNVGYETVGGQPYVSFYQADEYTYPTGACEVDWEGSLLCRLGDGVRVIGGSGDDGISAHDPDLGGFQPGAPYRLAFSGGAGDDRLHGAVLSDTLDGGEGFDDLDGGEANDVLLGGAGNDTLKGGDGADELRGGDGNDTLTGDERDSHKNTVSPDVLDGGPGIDKVEEDWYRFDDSANYLDPPPTVTLDGQANDGRPGENDNVLGIEEIYSSPGGTFTGSDAAEKFVMFSAASVSAGGGNDQIEGSVDPDRLDGGPGDDTIAGHSGDDVITGGPGRDTINGDRAASCFYGPIFGACSIPAGNDTIRAVDGEEDSIECDIGTDVAEVDAIDRVSGCEDVRVAKSTTPDNTDVNGDDRSTATQKCRVPKLKGLRLKAAKKRLARRNCRIGRIKPGPRKRRAGMVVRRQRPKPGTVRKAGGKVKVILGKRRR